MHINSLFRKKVILALSICLLLPLAGRAGEGGQLSRSEKMVMNLRIGHGSSGFYVLEAMRLSREIEADMRKALFQLREVDKSYAKSKGRPDDRFLERAAVKIADCQERARVLTTELEDTNLVLKETIKDTLVEGTQTR